MWKIFQRQSLADKALEKKRATPADRLMARQVRSMHLQISAPDSRVLEDSDRLFSRLFWHSPSSSPIKTARNECLTDYCLREIGSNNETKARELAARIAGEWRMLGLVEMGIDQSIITPSETGLDILRDTHRSPPRLYLIAKDMFGKPISLAVAAIGLLASIFGILQFYQGQ